MEIQLTQGKVALVDEADYEALRIFKWCARRTRDIFYAQRSTNSGAVLMHRIILGATANEQVDHRDGNGLNNTRANLRVCSHSENQHNQKTHRNNKSGYKGVHWNKSKRKWKAGIRSDGREKHLGYYEDPVDAARAYDKAATELYGKFARLNF